MDMLIALLKTFTIYWSDIILLALVITILLLLYKKGKIAIVKSIVTSLVVRAEKELGTSTGIAKYNQVVSDLYLSLPIIVKILFTKDDFYNYIYEAVKWLKTQLEDPNVNLLSYAEEAAVKIPEVNTKTVTPVIKYETVDGIALQPIPATITPLIP